MAKKTLFFIFFLSIIATLLLGINIGRKIGIRQSENQNQLISDDSQLPATTQALQPTSTPVKEESSISANVDPNTLGTSTYTNRSCGFSFSYPGSYMNQKSVNEQSIILTDPDDPDSGIATTCAQNLPRPPVSAEDIESITLDGVAATLFHDQTAEGTPRDEVIVKHPGRDLEIIIAGYGETFQSVLSSFEFIE